MESEFQTSFRIDGHTIFPSRNLIVTSDGEQYIEPKIMQVLILLAQEAGNVVSREQILNTVWQSTYMSDEVISRAISELRKAFGNDARSPKIIETIPKKGYRLIAEVQESSLDDQNTGKEEKGIIENNFMVSGVIAVVVFISIAGGLILYNSGSTSPNFDNQRIVPFTSYPGEEEDPALSPDGSRLAFTWNGGESGAQNVYVKLLNSEQPLQLTNSRLYEFSPAWSPDGSRIAYARYFEGIFAVPSLGGPEVKLTDIGNSSNPELDWSPDGNRLVFSDRSSASDPYRLYLLDIESHKKQLLTEPENPFLEDNFPRFSPDGNRVAFLRGTENSNDIYVYGITDGKTLRLTRDNLNVAGFSWNGSDNGIIYSSNRGGTYGLWEATLADRNIKPRNLSTSNLTYPTIARNADNALAFIEKEEDSNIWRIPIENETGKIRQVLASTQPEHNPRFSPDGSGIAFVSLRSGTPEIWIADSLGNNLRKVTSFHGPYVSNPHWSPDGQFLLCDIRDEGLADIYAINVAEGIAHPIIQSNSSDMLPRYTRDGQSFYFTSNRTGSWELWKSDLEGRDPIQITTTGGYAAEESLDGSLYYSKINEFGIWRKRPGDDSEQRIFDLSGINRANWSLTGRGIYFIDFKKSESWLQFYSFTDETVAEIRKLDKTAVWYQAGLTASPDGSHLLYTRLDRQDHDIMGIRKVE